MTIKTLLASMGWATRKAPQGKRLSPLAQERIAFEKEVREQFVKLKEKGISIPIFTL